MTTIKVAMAFSFYTSSPPANLKHLIPIGISRIVKQRHSPNPQINIAIGSLMNSQIVAVSMAPVTWNPIQNRNVNSARPRISSIIFLLSVDELNFYRQLR